MKRLLFIYIFIIPTLLFATEYSGTTGDCTWHLDTSSRVLTIDGNGAMGNYSKASQQPWHNKNFSCVIINEGVTKIGNYAFSKCYQLTSVELPNTVTVIGKYAFEECKVLPSITLNKKVTNILGHAFDSCFNLNTVNIPESVVGIGVEAFAHCWSLTSIVIPEKVKSIGSKAFYDCRSLDTVYINSNYITSSNYLAGDSEYSIEDHEIYKIFSKMTTGVSINNLILGDSVKEFGFRAFAGCSINSITFPSSIEKCDESAFWMCNIYKKVIIPDINKWFELEWTSYYDSVLSELPDPSNYYVYYEDDYVPYYDKYNKNYLIELFKNGARLYSDENTEVTNLVMPNGASFFLNRFSFQGCPSFKSLTLPSTISDIPDNAFAKCTGLSSLTIPSNVKTIGEGAFKDCKGLTSIEIPSTVKVINDNTFDNTGLTSLYLPEGITHIGKSAFSYCRALTTVNLPSSLKIIDNNAFYRCDKMTSVTFNDGCLCDTIGRGAFYYCLQLKKINLPSKIKSIGTQAFYDCHNLKSISLPDGIVSIENETFYNCKKLKNINFPTKLTSIGSQAFMQCSSLEEIILPEGLRTINFKAFNGCVRLTSISIPSSLSLQYENYCLFRKCPLNIIKINNNGNNFYLSRITQQDDNDRGYSFYKNLLVLVPVGTKEIWQRNWSAYENVNVYEMGEKFPYAIYDDDVLSFYYDTEFENRKGTLFSNLIRNGHGDLWGEFKLNIKRVVIDPSFAQFRPSSTAHWFNGCKNLEEISGLEYLNTSETTSMYAMFNGMGMNSKTIKTLDLTNFSTSKVTNMSYMFNCCSSITTINVSDGWSTDKVVESENMFNGCKSLVGGDGTKYDASLTGKSVAYAGDGGYLSDSSMSPEKIPYAVYSKNELTFYYDNWSHKRQGDVYTDIVRLSSKDKWGTHKLGIHRVVFDKSFADVRPVSTAHWFNGCKNLQEIVGLEYINTSNVTTMYGMFNGVAQQSQSIHELDLTTFNTSNVTDMSYMFNCCSSLNKIYVSNTWNTDNVETSDMMFNGCKKINGSYGMTYDSSKIDKTYAFVGQGGYLSMFTTTIPYAVFNNGTLTFRYDDQYLIFDGDVYSEIIRNKSGDLWGIHKLDIKKVLFDQSFADVLPTSTAHWFNGCKNLEEIIGIEYLNTSEVTNMYAMFNGVGQISKAITELDISHFNTSNVTNMSFMFNCCSSLKTIYVSDAWTTANVEESDNMFYNCKSIVGGDGTTYYPNYIDKTRAFVGLGGYFTATNNLAKDYRGNEMSGSGSDSDMIGTSIEKLVDRNKYNTVYTIQGRYVGTNIDIGSLSKGIYVVNGKKTVVK